MCLITFFGRFNIPAVLWITRLNKLNQLQSENIGKTDTNSVTYPFCNKIVKPPATIMDLLGRDTWHGERMKALGLLTVYLLLGKLS